MKTFMKKVISVSALFVLLFFIIFPAISFSAGGPSGGTGWAWECSPPGDCDFNDLVNAIAHLMNQVTIFVLGFSAVVIAWAGFLYLKSGGNPGELKKAKEVLQKVVIGLFFILAAWVIVRLIATTLLNDNVPLLLE